MVTTVSLEDVILEGAKEVFGSMVFLPLERAEGPVAQGKELAYLATITFKGDLEGCFSICCDQPCMQAIAAGMLCLEEGTTLSDGEIIDTIGEIANMIMGGIKTRVQHEVAGIEISIPSVVYGCQLQNRPGEAMSRVAVPVTIGQQYRAELSLLYRQRDP